MKFQTDIETYRHWLSPAELGKIVGVNEQRISALLKRTYLYPEGRIIGVHAIWIGKRVYRAIPPDPEIVRGMRVERDGPLKRYMDDWDERHGRNVRKKKRKRRENNKWKHELEDFWIGEK